MRVLVAEPERRLAGVIGQGLKEEGHSVEAALDGEAVLERLAEDPPYDLVVLDVALPRRDGLDVVRVLREHRIEALVLLLTERDRTHDPAAHHVTRAGRHIALTASEYALLEYFLRNAGQVLTRQMIAEHVWGRDGEPKSNVVDVYVGYLRCKIGSGGGAVPLLHTIRGVGYMLSAAP